MWHIYMAKILYYEYRACVLISTITGRVIITAAIGSFYSALGAGNLMYFFSLLACIVL